MGNHEKTLKRHKHGLFINPGIPRQGRKHYLPINDKAYIANHVLMNARMFGLIKQD